LEKWQVPFIKHLLFEIYVFDHLVDLKLQVGNWIQTVRSSHRKELVRLYKKASNIKENPESLSEFANSPSFPKVRRFLPSWSEAVETRCSSWRAKKQRQTLTPPLAPEAPREEKDLWHSKSTEEKSNQNPNSSVRHRIHNRKQRPPAKQVQRKAIANFKPSQIDKRGKWPESTTQDPRKLRFKLPTSSAVQRPSSEHNRFDEMRRRNESLCNTIRDLQQRLNYSERVNLDIKDQLDHYYRETVALKQHQFVLENEITMLRQDISSRGNLQLACTQELDHLKQERNHLYSELARTKAGTQEKYIAQQLVDSNESHASDPDNQFNIDTVKNPNTRDSVLVDHTM